MGVEGVEKANTKTLSDIAKRSQKVAQGNKGSNDAPGSKVKVAPAIESNTVSKDEARTAKNDSKQ